MNNSRALSRRIATIAMVASATVASIATATLPSGAANGDQLDRQTTDFVGSVQNFLTAQGKWPPPAGSPEMQLCSALQNFTQEVKRAPDISSSSNIGGSQQRLSVQRLSSSAQQVEASLSPLAPNADVSSRWMSIKSQINAAANYAYGMVPTTIPGNATMVSPGMYPATGAYPGAYPGTIPGNYPGTYPGTYPGLNPTFNTGINSGINTGIYNPGIYAPNNGYPVSNGYPGSIYPGGVNQGMVNQGLVNPGIYNPALNNQGLNNTPNFSSYANNLDSEMRGFSSFVQKSVMQGGFTNRDQTTLMTLTAALQNLQNTVKKTVNSLRGSGNIMQQQQNVQQLSMAIAQFEPAFNAAQPNPMVSSRYMSFKNSFMALQQAVAGNGMLLR